MIARSTNREREVGIRKVVGAQKMQLVRQFLGDSLLFSSIAIIFALLLVEIFLPVFNELANKNLNLNLADNALLLISLCGITFLVGILAGSYPAFFISSLKPVLVLKGITKTKKQGNMPPLNKMLVIFQFSATIILLTCTIVIYNQLNYIKNRKLGYNSNHIVVLPMYDDKIKSNYELFKNETLQQSDILGITATSYLPSEPGFYQNAWWEGLPENDRSNMMRWIPVDYDFIKALRIKIAEGRDFSKEIAGDKGEAYIINETAAREIGWDSPLGKQLNIIKTGTIIGVIKDFHFRSLHNKIEPVALYIFPEEYKYLYIKMSSKNIPATINFIKNKWEELAPGIPFDYSFFDEDFDKLYRSETRLGKIFRNLAGLAIFIACLGLFGLISFIARQRTKEIGIRKVLGASVSNIVFLLSREFLILIGIATIIAWPVVFYSMNKWLQNFAYRITIGASILILAVIVTIILALITVSFKAIKAATANPIKSLRYE